MKYVNLLVLIAIFLLSGCGGGGGSKKSSNADLSGLSISASALDQSFDTDLLGYSASVGNSITGTTVTAILDDKDASVTINGVGAESGKASPDISIISGDNVLDVVVTAENGKATKTYSVILNRESQFANRTPKFTYFIADAESDRIFDLYATLDDGSGQRVKLSNASMLESGVSDYAISVDGDYIAYRADQDDREIFELYVVPVDATSSSYKQTEASKISGALVSSGDVHSFAWSPIESKLIFLADKDTSGADELYMVDADGNNLVKINGSIGSVVEIGDYAWSDDGAYVAYKVYNRGLPEEVVGINSHEVGIVSPNPGFSVRLNPTLAADEEIKSFKWLAGTQTIAYLADQDVDGQDELYIASAGVSNTSTKKNHTLDANKSVMDYIGIGSYLAYQSEEASGSALYTSLQSGVSTGVKISDDAHDVLSFSASANNALLAYLADTGSADELFASSPDASVIARQLSSTLVNTGSVTMYAWSPDSSRIAYIADQEVADVYELYSSAADGADNGQKMSGEPLSNGDVLAFSWSPDNSQLAYLSDDEQLGVVQLYTTALDDSWRGNKLSTRTVLNSSDTGVIKFDWVSDSTALVYQGTETRSGFIDVYGNLADGGIQATTLTGTVIDIGGLLVRGSVTELFEDGSWLVPHHDSELCGITYDAAENAMYINKCTGGRRNNKIMRYSFSNNSIRKVFEIPDQLQYGIRIFDDNLWLANTYRESVIRLGSLDQPALTEIADYFGGEFNTDLTEVVDLALSEGDIYFITGNFLTSDNHQGIQTLPGPDFDSISELVSEASSGWTSSQSRAIVPVGAGANAHLVVAAGTGQDLERWDLNGNFINSNTGEGEGYLQVDSQDRIFKVSTNFASSEVTRWDANLANEVNWAFTSEYSFGNNMRFILKECGDCIDIYMTQFRSRDPRFEKTTIPK